jgi:hypothetical protein
MPAGRRRSAARRLVAPALLVLTGSWSVSSVSAPAAAAAPAQRAAVPAVWNVGLVSSADQLTNWAGYAQVDGPNPYTEVTDSFVVPTVDTSVKGTQIMSDWVGIGGVQVGDRLIQAGIQSVNLKGTAYYTAWTEEYPHPERTLQLALEPGDTVTVTVTHTKKKRWLLVIEDGTETAQRSIVVKDKLTESNSVEAIEERPCDKAPCNAPNDFANLAQTSNVTFVPGSFSTAAWGKTPVEQPLLATGDSGPNRFVMSDGEGDTLAVPSSPDSAADGFTVADGTATPSPPTS